MTRARNVLVAFWCRSVRISPIGVYGPTMKISNRPITSGGSRRLQSTPASHTRGNGSLPRASIQDRGVQMKASTPSVTSPDSSEVATGWSAPGCVSALAIALPEMWSSRTITGPIRATQITPAPTTETIADAEPTRARPCWRRRPGGRESPGTAPPAAAAGLDAQLTQDLGRHCGRGAEDRRGQYGEAAVPVLGDSRGRQRVPDERDPGRSRLADDRDVDDLRRPVLDHAAHDLHRRCVVQRRVSEAAQVDGGRQLDVVQVQLDRLGDERAGPSSWPDCRIESSADSAKISGELAVPNVVVPR